MKNRIGLALLLLSLLIPYSGSGGYIRHDATADAYEALGAQPELQSVGWIGDKQGETLLGSCVLVDSLHVLTAAHNLFEYKFQKHRLANGEEVEKVAEERMLPLGFLRVWFNQKNYEIVDWTCHPDYRLGTGPDLMLLKLNKSVKNTRPAQWGNSPTLPKGAKTVWCGYSPLMDANFKRTFGTEIKRRAGENRIDSSMAYLGWLNWGKPSALLLADMDHPEFKSMSRTGSGEALPLEYLSSSGDSGGGVFFPDSNGWKLIGIIHANRIRRDGIPFQGLYGAEMTCTELAPFSHWLSGAL